MVKKSSTKPIDIRNKEKVLELQKKGFTRKQIQKYTGVSETSQRRISKKMTLNLSLENNTPSRKLWNNGHSKYTESYCEILRLLVKEKDDLINKEYIEEMERKTGIKLSERSMSRLMKRLNITTKKKRLFMKIHFFQ
jgi:transposase